MGTKFKEINTLSFILAGRQTENREDQCTPFSVTHCGR